MTDGLGKELRRWRVLYYYCLRFARV